MKRSVVTTALLLCAVLSYAQIDSTQIIIDNLEASLQYTHGEIKFDNGIGTLNVPQGFRYLDAKQSRYVLEELWGNPADSAVMGMILPDSRGVLADDSWAFIVTYEAMGYVKDDDADDIDYAELLDEMKSDAVEENKLREESGYVPIEIVGWASAPYYDDTKKVLHWAKEIRFGDTEENTLNYNVRILGRNGVLVLNAVSPMTQLAEVKKNIGPVLSSFEYADGTKYSDFDPGVDQVAAWTIGGLVAGKVLAKVGVFAFLLKYLKFIAIAVGAAGTGIWKWYKRKTELPTVRNIEESANS